MFLNVSEGKNELKSYVILPLDVVFRPGRNFNRLLRHVQNVSESENGLKSYAIYPRNIPRFKNYVMSHT